MFSVYSQYLYSWLPLHSLIYHLSCSPCWGVSFFLPAQGRFIILFQPKQVSPLRTLPLFPHWVAHFFPASLRPSQSMQYCCLHNHQEPLRHHDSPTYLCTTSFWHSAFPVVNLTWTFVKYMKEWVKKMNLHWLALKGKVQRECNSYASSSFHQQPNQGLGWSQLITQTDLAWERNKRHKFTELEVLKHFYSLLLSTFNPCIWCSFTHFKETLCPDVHIGTER